MMKNSGFKKPSLEEIKEKQAKKRLSSLKSIGLQGQKLRSKAFKVKKVVSLSKNGIRGKMNQKSNSLIREYLESNPINHCEVKLEGCLGSMFLQVAHRKRRNEYKSAEELADPKNWVCACQNCHQELDRRTPEAWKLTEEVFNKLR